MDNRVMQFRVGVMVLATLIIAGILVVQLGELPNMVRGSYDVRIWFPEAPDVDTGTPVYKSGVRIGRVKGVKLAEDVEDSRFETGVIVTAKIDGKRSLYQNEDCWIEVSLMGDSSLRFRRARDAARTALKIDAEKISVGRLREDPTNVLSDLNATFSTVTESVVEASDSLAGASDKLGVTAESVTKLLKDNEKEFNRALEQAAQTMVAIKQAATNVNEIIGEEETRAQIKDMVKQLPQMMTETRQTISRMKGTMDLVDNNLQNLSRFTGTIGSEEMVARLESSTRNLDQLMRDVSMFSRAINDQKGSLGQFVHNRELYDRLNHAAKNLDSLSWQLKPIVRDVRVFTDKIARHPGVIVRDAVRPGVGTK